MKIVDDFIAKIGHDKFDHHILGALICALFSFVAILQDGVINWYSIGYPTIGVAVVFFLSIIKEYALDDKVNWGDILHAMLGCLWVFAAVALGVLFNQLSS